MAGFLEHIAGDGSFGQDWKHRDIDNCKVYNNDSYDVINGLAKAPFNSDQPWTFFFEINLASIFIGDLFGNINALDSSPLTNYLHFDISSNQVRYFYRIATGARIYIRTQFPLPRKRSILTVKKLAGKGASNYFFFLNGIEFPKQIFEDNPTIGTDFTGATRPFSIGGADTALGKRIIANISQLSVVNYAQSDLEIARDAALGYQQATSGLFLLNVDFDKTTGENLTDLSPNAYTITTTGSKNFTNFYT